MQQPLHITNAQSLDLAQQFTLKHFCKQYKQPLPQQQDFVAIAWRDQKIVGLVRLICCDGVQHYWLRGLFVAPNARKQGVARALISQLDEQLVQHFGDSATENGLSITLFSLPYLQRFYESEGYWPVASFGLPKEIVDPWQKSQSARKNWILMQKTINCR